MGRKGLEVGHVGGIHVPECNEERLRSATGGCTSLEGSHDRDFAIADGPIQAR